METRVIARAPFQTRAKSSERAKHHSFQHHYQPGNSTWEIGTSLSQLQH